LLDQRIDLRIDATYEAAPVVGVDLSFKCREEVLAVATGDGVSIEENFGPLGVIDIGSVDHPVFAGDGAARLCAGIILWRFVGEISAIDFEGGDFRYGKWRLAREQFFPNPKWLVIREEHCETFAARASFK